MLGRIRLLFFVTVALVLAVFLGDWALSRTRLSSIAIEAELDPPEVVADGKSYTTLTVRVTEDGRPRDQVLLQSFIAVGGGLLIPEWAYTDANGEARITYTPNPLSPYDLDEETVIEVIDTNVGRLVEVTKHYRIEVPLKVPQQAEAGSSASQPNSRD